MTPLICMGAKVRTGICSNSSPTLKVVFAKSEIGRGTSGGLIWGGLPPSAPAPDANGLHIGRCTLGRLLRSSANY